MLTITILSFGTLGVAVRFFADTLIRLNAFPLSTFLVNLIGCFIAGWILTTPNVSSDSKIPVIIGFCGGLTTFSALIIQSLQMLRMGEWQKAIAYLMISQIAGLLFAWAGMKTGEL